VRRVACDEAVASAPVSVVVSGYEAVPGIHR